MIIIEMVDNNKKLSTLIVAVVFFGPLFVGFFAIYELFQFEAEVLRYKTDTSPLQAFAEKFTAQLPGIPQKILEEKGFVVEKNTRIELPKNAPDFTKLAINLLLISGGVGISILGLIIYLLKREKTHQLEVKS